MDAMPDTISVIVPVYNAEKYLARCVDSIVCQTKKELEILLIDDGSTDSSGAICDSYLADSRVRVFHIVNGGVGAARNFGISQATGKYIAFVDSDDVCHPELLERLHSALSDDPEKAMSLCGISFFYEYPQVTKAVSHNAGTYSVKEYIEAILLPVRTGQFCGAPYCKLFHTDILRENGVLYPTDTTFAEDFIFNIRYLHHINKVHIVDAPLYFYQSDTANSLTQKNYGKFHWPDIWLQRQAAFAAFEGVFAAYGLLEANRDGVNRLLTEFVIVTEKLACKFLKTKKDCLPILRELCQKEYFLERPYSGSALSGLDKLRLQLLRRKHASLLYALETTRYAVGRLLKKV